MARFAIGLNILLFLNSCSLVNWYENRSIFRPDSQVLSKIEIENWEYQDIEFTTSDQLKLRGIFARPKNVSINSNNVILFFYGNRGNMTHRYPWLSAYQKLGLPIFIFDYRGYGQSEGKPSEEGLYQDAQAAFEWLQAEKHIPSNRIVLFGRSLGAAVAIDLATKVDAACIIIESAFSNTRSVAKNSVPTLPLPAWIPNRFNNVEKSVHITEPKLVIHGKNDRAIPMWMSQRIFENMTEPKFFYEVKDAGHSDILTIGGEAYLEQIQNFLGLHCETGLL